MFQCGVFSPSPKNHYLNITPKNLVRLYDAQDGRVKSLNQVSFESSDFVVPVSIAVEPMAPSPLLPMVVDRLRPAVETFRAPFSVVGGQATISRPPFRPSVSSNSRPGTPVRMKVVNSHPRAVGTTNGSAAIRPPQQSRGRTFNTPCARVSQTSCTLSKQSTPIGRITPSSCTLDQAPLCAPANIPRMANAESVCATTHTSLVTTKIQGLGTNSAAEASSLDTPTTSSLNFSTNEGTVIDSV